jgi:hypothetical protein
MWSGWVKWGGACGAAWLGLAVVACESDSSAPPPDDTPAGWGVSACGQCVHTACAAAVDACSADPGCAAYLTCLDGCALNALGDVDPACEAACPVPDSSTSRELEHSLTVCRIDGDGKGCPCGAPSSIFDQQCSDSPETNPCWICEDENCCDTYAACQADPDCQAIAPCTQACGEDDDACFNQCFIDHAAGMDAWGPRFMCFTVECDEECAGETIDPCFGCTLRECERTEIACDSDVSCWLLAFCIGDCGSDGACVQACNEQYPDGVALFEQHAVCAVDRCADVCG